MTPFVRLRTWWLWNTRRPKATFAVLATVAVLGLFALNVHHALAQARAAQASAVAPLVAPVAPITSPTAPAIATAAPASLPSPTATATVSGPALAGDGGINPDQAPAVQAAGQAFAQAFLAGTTQGDRGAWTGTLAPLVQPALAPYLDAVPPEAIPTAALTGVEVLSASPYGGTAVAHLADGTGITIQLDDVDGHLLVSEYGPAQ